MYSKPKDVKVSFYTVVGLMRLLVRVTVRNSRSSALFPSTVWSTAQGYFY